MCLARAVTGLALFLAAAVPQAENLVTAASPPLADRLEAHVRFLTGLNPPRNFDNPESLERAADYVREHFRDAGLEPEGQIFQVQGNRYRNVRAFIGPEDAPVVVVGAHYDVHGPLPGADDNASAVAVLLELAPLLAKAEIGKRIELVGYTLEEQPAFGLGEMGSGHHARLLKQQGVPVHAMLSLEMLGYYSDEPGSQKFPYPGFGLIYPDTGNFVGVVGRLSDWWLIRDLRNAMRPAMQMPVHALASPIEFYGLANSDHRNFWDAGYSAVMVTDTAFYRNPNYHKASDTPDTLDYGRMAQVVTGLEAAISKLAE